MGEILPLIPEQSIDDKEPCKFFVFDDTYVAIIFTRNAQALLIDRIKYVVSLYN